MAGSRIALGLIALPGGLALTAALADGGLRLLRGGTVPGGDPAAAITGLTAVLAALITAWITLCLALALVAEAPGVVGETARRARDRITPAVVRQWAALVLGAAVTATFVPGTAVAAVRVATDPTPGHGAGSDGESAAPSPGGASAAPSPGWAPPSTPSGQGTSSSSAPASVPAPGFSPTPGTAPVTPQSGSPTPGPGWVPRRPVTRERTDAHLLTGRQRAADEEPSVVVQRGDTLWSLAAARLGPEATDAEVARAWPRWHAANASVVGQDPHHLLPGTLLTPPSTD